MIQQIDGSSSSFPASVPLEQNADASEGAFPEPGAVSDDEDWSAEASDWRRKPREAPDPALALKGLDHEQIRERHIRMLNELTEQAFPLASEFLKHAQEVSPLAQGHDKLINMGCKLISKTNSLIKTSAQLAGK